MSLILEALKKLERDRHTHDRGFLVLAPSAWSPAGEHTRVRGAALLAVAALAGAGVAALWLRPARVSQDSLPAAAPAAPPATLTAAALPPSQPSPASAAPRVDSRWQGRKAGAPPADRPAVEAAPVAQVPAGASLATGTEPEQAEPPAEDLEPAVSAEEAPAAPAAGQPLRLEAIAERDGQPVAVVSGQVVRVGDQIGATTIIRIGTSEIEVETGGLRRIIRF